MSKRWLTVSFLLTAWLMSNAGAAGLDGYDPIAYFTAGKPLKGSSAITTECRGEIYQFSSTKNRDTFITNPGQHLPQYGGYCA